MPIASDTLLLLTIPAAIVLDLLVGDPVRLPHPIRWMGAAINTLEPRFRSFAIAPAAAGALMALALIGATWLICTGILAFSQRVSPLMELATHVIMLYYALSIRSLADAGRDVWRALRKNTLQAAKDHLQMIVGRDVKPLDKTGVIRATVETVAENLVDGVISPLFYALVGGPALAMTFKMINTLDSMIGYKNDRYLQFGRWAAKIDDLANWAPARLCVPIISLAAQLLAKKGVKAFYMAKRDGRNHSSPNAGYAEAAFAGVLALQLGGPNYYQGIWVKKPFIGDSLKKPQTHHIARACDLMVLSAVLWGLAVWLVNIALRLG